MKIVLRCFLFIVLILVAFSTAFASDEVSLKSRLSRGVWDDVFGEKWDLTASVGGSYGGSPLVDFDVTDSSGRNFVLSTQNGVGYFANIGVFVTNYGVPIKLRFSAGYHYESAESEYGNISFTRIPIEIEPIYFFGKAHGFGVGAIYSFQPKLDMSEVLEDKLSVDANLGYFLGYHYRFLNEQIGIGARYTFQSFQIKNQSSSPAITADSFSLVLELTL